MNREFNGFDEMVEALEENEDMVECKECFDLVPKTDCERAEVGYICPTCKGLRTAPAQARFVDPYDSYTQEFPEVTEYDPNSVVEYEKEPSLGDALSDLIADEYEAIDGYEVADETIQHADIDEDEKDEILDTLDHIKEEEEEHIDELKEICPECDPVAEPEAESEVEPEKLEEAADDKVADEEAEVEEIPEEESPEEEAEDSEENENEEVSDLESAYEAALEIANESGVGQVFGYARKETEEFVAVEPFEVDDPEAVEDDLMAVYDDVAYAYVAYPEKELSEALYEGMQLNEGIFDKSTKIFNTIAAKGFEVVASPAPADNANAKLKSGQKFNKGEYDKARKFAQMASSITKTSLWGIKIVEPEAALKEAGLTDASLLNLLKENKNILTVYKAGKETVNNKTFLKDLATILKSHKMASKLGITDTTAGRDNFETDPEPSTDPEPEPEIEAETETAADPRDKAKAMLGEKKASDGYTPESYKKYEAAYAKILAWIEAHPNPSVLTQERIDNLKNQAEAKLKEVEDADPDLKDEDEVETTTSDETFDDTSEDEEEVDTMVGEEEIDIPEEEEVAETVEDETEDTAEVKLSEVSEEQLKKLYTAVTGQGVGDNKKWQKVLARMRAKLQELGESLDPQDYSAEDFIEEEFSSEAEVAKSLKDTQATLKSTADSLKNMTNAMKESILNLSPADFAECVDSSRVELWGLEEPEDGVAEAVLIKSYDDISDEDIQSCHDEMLELGGMFTFSFTASGKPSVYGWNAEQLRELIQAGIKGISFDNPAYEEAISLAWRIK